MSSDVWKIRLLGGFQVEPPGGGQIEIPSRKARAVVALLALNDGVSMTRESLGQHLWPDKPRINQQQSLRQALKDLKEAFGSHQILEVTRDVCRISLDNYLCDALECLNSGKDIGNLPFLPEMPEPVFESYRTELAGNAPLGDLGDAARGAASLLEWIMAQEPARALDMLYTCRELIPNMPLPLIESALRLSLSEAAESHALRHWGLAQLAIVLMWAGACEEGIRVAKEALGNLQPGRDSSDWAAAVHTAASFLIFRGRFEKARNLLESAIDIADSHGLEDAANRFRHADALRHAYSGDFEQSLRLLEQLPANVFIDAHCASYYAVAEMPERARERLEAAKAKAAGVSDVRVISQLRIAEGYTLISEKKSEEARALLQELIPFCDRNGIRIVLIHALEGLALLATEKAAQAEYLKKAMSLRETYRFSLQPGDLKRLASVLPG